MFELPQSRIDQRNLQNQQATSQSLENTIVGAVQHLIQYLDGKVTKTEVLNQISSVNTPDMVHVVDALHQLTSVVGQKDVDLSPVVLLLKQVHAELQSLPKELPEAPEQQKSIEVSNLANVKEYFSSLETTIKGLKLTAEAPKVDVKVPQPKVTVEKTDLSPLQHGLLAVVDAVKAVKIPEVKPTDMSGVEKRLEGLGEWQDLQVKELKDANKSLKKLVDKPVGAGGGGGGSSSNGLLVPFPFDTITYTNTSSTIDTYNYTNAGSAVATVTITYTDATKGTIASVVRS